MRAINHALTGALIGLTIGEPLVAAPLALASHYICDAIPHHDFVEPDPGDRVRRPAFLRLLIPDLLLCAALVAVLFISRPLHWFLASVCAGLAALPDAFWLNQLRVARAHRPWRPNIFSKFALNLQWFARPIGAVVEVTWFAAGIFLVLPFLR